MENLLIQQLFEKESSTYTYLLADKTTKEAVLIDPVIETIDRDLKAVEMFDVKLTKALNTHVHADHITGTGIMKEKVPGLKSVLGKSGNEEAKADIKLEHGEKLKFGQYELEARSTPGHTDGCHSYVLTVDADHSFVFTGDLVLVGGCGRCDFQQGNAETMYDSVHNNIYTLPDHTIIYPAHDYKGFTQTTVGIEKRTNPRLKLDNSKQDFVKIMDNLNLPYPKKIEESLPMNKVCGVFDLLSDADKKLVQSKRQKKVY